MRTAIAHHDLLPRSLYLDSPSIETGRIGIRVASNASKSRCPVCGLVSSRVHSRYSRSTVSDLPWHGLPVTLEVRARRFFCDEPSCERKIICERLPEVAARARKMGRLEEALLAIALETRRQGRRQAGPGVGNRRRSRHLAQEDQGRAPAGGREGQGSRRGRFRLQEGQHLRHDPRRSRTPQGRGPSPG
jgi:hypothetical protein